MNKWAQFAIGVIIAGLAQYAVLATAGIEGTPLYAGIAGAVATAAGGLLKQLPQREWTEEERAIKLGKE